MQAQITLERHFLSGYVSRADTDGCSAWPLLSVQMTVRQGATPVDGARAYTGRAGTIRRA